MRGLMAVVAALSGLFAFLNVAGGIISGIWLLVLGEWRIIVMGLLVLGISSFILAIILAPMIPLGLGAAAAARRKSVAGLVGASALSGLYAAFAITAWCMVILFVFASRATPQSWIPMLLWTYGVAVGPWGSAALEEDKAGGGGASLIGVFFAQTAFLVTVIVGGLTHATYLQLSYVFGAVMIPGVVLTTIIAYEVAKAEFGGNVAAAPNWLE